MKPALWLTLLLFPLASLSAQKPTSIALGIPDDVHFFVHGFTSQSPDPGWVRFENAVRHLVDSRVHEDVIDLATTDMSPRQREEVRAGIAHVLGVLGQVDWGLLMAEEVAVGYRLATPMPEYVFICRVPEDRMGAQMAGVQGMLAGFAQMAGLSDDAVREVERRSGNMTVFQMQGIPVQFAAGAVGDALVLSTSTRMAARSMAMLGRGDGDGALVGSDRFKSSLAHLPAPTEDVLFVDMAGIFGYMQETLGLVKATLPDGGDRAAWGNEIVGIISTLVEAFDVMDHVMVTTVSDGTTVTSTSLVQLQPDFESTGIAAAALKQERWADWQKRVPADATGFAFDPGMNPVAMLDLILGRMRESSEPMAAMLDAQAGKVGEVRDILSHISGEIAWVTFPQAAPDGCALGETVMFLRLDKPKGVAAFLPEMVGGCVQYLVSRGQDVEAETVDDLYHVRLGAFPWMHPVVGVRGDELVVASSPAALAKIDRVGQGLESGIADSKRFAALGIAAGDDVEGLMYGRVDATMGGLPDMVSAAGFFLSLLPEDRDTRPVIKLGAILTKLAPALRELDMSYDFGTEVVPGPTPQAFISKTVYRYRDGQ